MVDKETPTGSSSSYAASIHDKSPAGVVDQGLDAEIDSDKTDLADSPNLAGDSTYIVDWDGPDDPENPLNWTTARKAMMTTSIALITFLT